MQTVVGSDFRDALATYGTPDNLARAIQDLGDYLRACEYVQTRANGGQVPPFVVQSIFAWRMSQSAQLYIQMAGTSPEIHVYRQSKDRVLFYTGGLESQISRTLEPDRDLVYVDPALLADFERVEIPLMILGSAMGYQDIALGIEAADTHLINPTKGLLTWVYTQEAWLTWRRHSGVTIRSLVGTLSRDALTRLAIDLDVYRNVNSCDSSTPDAPSWCGRCFKCGLQWLTHEWIKVPQDHPRVHPDFANMSYSSFGHLIESDLVNHALSGGDPFLNMAYVQRVHKNHLRK